MIENTSDVFINKLCFIQITQSLSVSDKIGLLQNSGLSRIIIYCVTSE